MSEREPITAELRDAMGTDHIFCDVGGLTIARNLTITQAEFDRLCDAIDAVHAGLERENAELRQRVAELDKQGDSMHIGSASVTITPTLDWTGVARELRSIADMLAGDAE